MCLSLTSGVCHIGPILAARSQRRKIRQTVVDTDVPHYVSLRYVGAILTLHRTGDAGKRHHRHGAAMNCAAEEALTVGN
jgi:hypothetical protein